MGDILGNISKKFTSVRIRGVMYYGGFLDVPLI